MFVLQQPTFFMAAPIQSSIPGSGRVIVLWLTSIVLGALLILLGDALFIKHASTSPTKSPVGPLTVYSLAAAIFSLPALIFLPVTARIWWAISTKNLLQRHLRLLLVIGSLFGLATLFAYWLVGCIIWLFSGTGRGWQIAVVFWVATPYSAGLLLSAYLLYAKWIFRPSDTLV
jgi:hypothetical protein